MKYLSQTLSIFLLFVFSHSLSFAQSVISRPFNDEILYFIMPDRFCNGNPENDYGDDTIKGNRKEDILRHGYMPTAKGFYHGGDIKGIIEKLPYLQDLGITAIWVAPVFRNKPVQQDSSHIFGHSSGYHGYWITDFMNADPHIGTNEDLHELIEKAHSKGIKIFLDIITNHTADVIRLEKWPERDYEKPLYHYIDKRKMPYLDLNGNPFNDSVYAYYGQEEYRFPDMNINGYPYKPILLENDKAVKNPAWLNNPLYYHNRGNTTFQDENSLYGDFLGLDDLFTEKKEVVEGMISIYEYWINEFGIDGFRVDTARHVNVEFWQIFCPEILKAAHNKGIKHFFMFGEVFDQRPEFLSYFTTTAGFQAVLDFGFQNAAREFASQSREADRLKDFFEKDDYYNDSDSDVYSMPVFLGNHDMGRFGYFLKEDNPGASDDELLARTKLAYALLFFARGIPVIYYGDEQGFTGDGGDKDAREDMFPSKVDAYNDNQLICTRQTTAESNFNETHPIYRSIQTYADIYKNNKALRHGVQIYRYSDDGPGIYAFSRMDPEEKIEYVVVLNNDSRCAQRHAAIPTFHNNIRFDLIYSSDKSLPRTVKTDAKGNLPVAVNSLGSLIYKASKKLQYSSDLPDILVSNLKDGERIIIVEKEDSGYKIMDRIAIESVLSSPVSGKVTLSVKTETEEQYRVVGSDFSPPYCIYFDATDYTNNNRLDFKVTFNDFFGRNRTTFIKNVSFLKKP